MNFKEITIIADECYNLQEEINIKKQSLTELENKLIEKTKQLEELTINDKLDNYLIESYEKNEVILRNKIGELEKEVCEYRILKSAAAASKKVGRPKKGVWNV